MIQSHSRAGLTLLELLVSLAIFTLIVTALYAVFHVVVQASIQQQAREQGIWTRFQALEILRKDVQQAFVPPGKDAAFVIKPLSGSGQETEKLDLYTLQRKGSEVWNVEPVLVVYRREDHGAGGFRLLREQSALSGPDALQPPQTSVVVKSLSHFQIEASRAGAWSSTWPEGDSAKHPLPEAVRVTVAGPEKMDKPLVAEMIVPTGLVITSSITRVGAPAKP